MYDALVIGARCAGSPTAMLLARKGYRVLLVDKASFPSDCISTHYIHLPGIALLKRWGLLEKLAASNCPPITHMSFIFGEMPLSGSLPSFDSVTAAYCPRRTVLDKLLVDAAVEAGAELREDFLVQELCMDGERVTGVRGHSRNGPTEELHARIVIGADGKHSLVARSVQAPTYNTHPTLTCAYYAYWSGVPATDFEGYTLNKQKRVISLVPTNDDLVIVNVIWPQEEFAKYRSDVDNNFFATIDLFPDLATRMRSGKRESRFRGTADMPNFFRRPYGPGWALVGDAGYYRDAITAFGISDAFRDVQLLTDAIDAGFSGHRPLNEALADYEQQRNEVASPLYDLTYSMASFEEDHPEYEQLLQALGRNPAETTRFLSVVEGIVSAYEFFDPANMARIIEQNSPV